MSRCLMLDVGAGTLDVLWLDEESAASCKAVLVSPARTVAERARAAATPLVVVGREMGGGELKEILAQKARQGRVVITPAAAATLSHQLDKVRALGLEIMVEEQALGLCSEKGFSQLVLADIDAQRIADLLEVFAVPAGIDEIGICLQDHGRPQQGVSHLQWRMMCFAERLSRAEHPSGWGFEAPAIDETFGRLRSAAADAAALEPARLYLMDSSLAAVAGAAWQARQQGAQKALVVDAATSHTVAATFLGEELLGYFELHTRDANVELVDRLTEELLHGRLEPEEVLRQGGHGAWCKGALGGADIFLAVGPKRQILSGSRYSFQTGAPLGDAMLAGCAGLLLAMGKLR